MAQAESRTPILPITELEQAQFCRSDSDLRARPLADEMQTNVRWQKIPDSYLNLTADALDARIHDARQRLGVQAMILGHHYQRDEVIKYTDFQGDSFKLSRLATQHPESEYIVFCGVHFMAETADVLSSEHQKVILPNLTAGCSMADMAPTDEVLDCWDSLLEVLGPKEILPITYMNSTAAIKALCGSQGGVVCTSSNAEQAMMWAFQQSERVLFLPDQHLGRNTALSLGIPLDEMQIWNPFKRLGGLTPEQIRRARVILWRGHCSVHTRFRVSQIESARNRYPEVQIIVHPECTMEVVQAADVTGSTESIIKTIDDAPNHTTWAVGTEISLVHRLARRNPDKTIFCLDPVVCPCSTMYRTHPAYLAWVLEELVKGNVANRIMVDPSTKAHAREALQRMMRLTEEPPLTTQRSFIA